MRIISFEGVEGVGKTTQLRLLNDYLESKNFLVEVYREPGSTNTGERIRDILKINNDYFAVTLDSSPSIGLFYLK